MISIDQLQDPFIINQVMAVITKQKNANGALKAFRVEFAIKPCNLPWNVPSIFYFTDLEEFKKYRNIFAVLGNPEFNIYLKSADQNFDIENKKFINSNKPTPVITKIKNIHLPRTTDLPNKSKKLFIDALKKNVNIVDLKFPEGYIENKIDDALALDIFTLEENIKKNSIIQAQAFKNPPPDLPQFTFRNGINSIFYTLLYVLPLYFEGLFNPARLSLLVLPILFGTCVLGVSTEIGSKYKGNYFFHCCLFLEYALFFGNLLHPLGTLALLCAAFVVELAVEYLSTKKVSDAKFSKDEPQQFSKQRNSLNNELKQHNGIFFQHGSTNHSYAKSLSKEKDPTNTTPVRPASI